MALHHSFKLKLAIGEQVGNRSREVGKRLFTKLKREEVGQVITHLGLHNWLKWKDIYSTGIFSTPWICTVTYSHPQDGQSSISAPDRLYRLPLCLRKVASKSRPLKSS